MHGFSYGSLGTALRSKKLVVSVAMGASQTYYAPGSVNFSDLLTPAKTVCTLMGTESTGNLPLYGMLYVNHTDETTHADMVKHSREHARRPAEFAPSL